MGLTAGAGAGAGAAISLTTSTGTAAGGIFVAIALVMLFAYLHISGAMSQITPRQQRFAMASALPLIATFGAIVLFESFTVIG